MKRTWPIIGVANVLASFKWYQSLLGLPATMEFSLRDLDGYYVAISSLDAA